MFFQKKSAVVTINDNSIYFRRVIRKSDSVLKTTKRFQWRIIIIKINSIQNNFSHILLKYSKLENPVVYFGIKDYEMYNFITKKIIVKQAFG